MKNYRTFRQIVDEFAPSAVKRSPELVSRASHGASRKSPPTNSSYFRGLCLAPRDSVPVLIAVAFLGGIGCAAEPPANTPLSPVATAHIRESMSRAVAGANVSRMGGRTDFSLTPAGALGRWDDVELAVVWAVDEGGVEMAMLDMHEFPWGTIFELRTVEGWPARLVVEKAVDEEGRVVGIKDRQAEVGRFPERTERQTRARVLEEAFDRWVGYFGRKRAPTIQPDSSSER